MKKIIILVFVLIIIGCKSQTPILPRYNDEDRYGAIKNTYYKDTDNVLNPYEGTWIYDDGTINLKIVLLKKYKVKLVDFYSDYIVGEYQLKLNNQEIVNTISSIDLNGNNLLDYNLWGNIMVTKDRLKECNECDENEKRLLIDFNEPSRRDVAGLYSKMIIRKYTESGQEKLKIWFYQVAPSYGFLKNGITPTSITSYSLPYGEYTVIKE
jgi:hypothetical protein